jgi:membrane protease YdiL (CAAX protease family)
LRELGFRMPTPGNIGIALLGAVAMALVANGGATLIDYLAHSQHQQDIVEIFKQLHDTTTIVLFAVFAIVFAPFAEETFFRLLFFNLGLRYGGFWAGAILSGVLFGIAHGDLYAAIPLALGGMVLCGVYYRTRNIIASMFSHALFNTLSIVVLLAGPKLS